MDQIETFTPKELAAQLRIPYRLVLGAIKRGELRAIHYTSKLRRIHSKDAAKWIQSITK